jgi:hypothetical protein
LRFINASLDALIRERMKSGSFQSAEDVLMQALKSSLLPAGKDAGRSDEISTAAGADLVAAMRSSPYKELDLEPRGDRLPVSDVVF